MKFVGSREESEVNLPGADCSAPLDPSFQSSEISCVAALPQQIDLSLPSGELKNENSLGQLDRLQKSLSFKLKFLTEEFARSGERLKEIDKHLDEYATAMWLHHKVETKYREDLSEAIKAFGAEASESENLRRQAELSGAIGDSVRASRELHQALYLAKVSNERAAGLLAQQSGEGNLFFEFTKGIAEVNRLLEDAADNARYAEIATKAIASVSAITAVAIAAPRLATGAMAVAPGIVLRAAGGAAGMTLQSAVSAAAITTLGAGAISIIQHAIEATGHIATGNMSRDEAILEAEKQIFSEIKSLAMFSASPLVGSFAGARVLASGVKYAETLAAATSTTVTVGLPGAENVIETGLATEGPAPWGKLIRNYLIDLPVAVVLSHIGVKGFNLRTAISSDIGRGSVLFGEGLAIFGVSEGVSRVKAWLDNARVSFEERVHNSVNAFLGTALGEAFSRLPRKATSNDLVPSRVQDDPSKITNEIRKILIETGDFEGAQDLIGGAGVPPRTKSKLASELLEAALDVGRDDMAREIRMRFGISAFREAVLVRKLLCGALRSADTEKAWKIVRTNSLGALVMRSASVRASTDYGIKISLASGDIDAAEQLLLITGRQRRELRSPQFAEAAAKGIERSVLVADANTIDRIVARTKIPRHVQLGAVVNAVLRLLSGHERFWFSVQSIGRLEEILRQYPLPRQVVESPGMKRFAAARLNESTHPGYAWRALFILEHLSVPKEEIPVSKLEESFDYWISTSFQDRNLRPFGKRFLAALPEGDLAIGNAPFGSLRQIINNFAVSTWGKLYAVVEREIGSDEFFKIILEYPDQCRLTRQLLEDAQTLGIDAYVANQLAEHRYDISDWARRRDFSQVPDALRATLPNWRTERFPGFHDFLEGERVFGSKRMLSYAKKIDADPNTYFSGFRNVVRMWRESGLTAEQFFENILAQVARDTAAYVAAGSSHGLLAHIGEVLNLSRVGTLADSLRDFPEAAAWARKFEAQIHSPSDIFSSWRLLKGYYFLCRFVDSSAYLRFPRELGPNNQKAFQWLNEVALSLLGNIDPNSAIRFHTHPDVALAYAGDNHLNGLVQRVRSAIHAEIAPNNYAKVPFLDLSSEQVVAALGDGTFDRLQSLPPLELRYRFEVQEGEGFNLETSPVARLGEAFAKHNERSHWNYRNRKRLYDAIRRLIQEENLGGAPQDIVEGRTLLTPDAEKKLSSLLSNPELVARRKIPVTIVAKIAAKSDPDNALAGSRIPGCMPFGCGISNAFIFNPEVGQFVVKVERPGREAQWLSQSVLLRLRNTGQRFGLMKDAIEKVIPEMHLLDVDGLAKEGEDHIGIDTIEIPPNMQTPEIKKVLRQIYGDFFRTYLSVFSDQVGLHPEAIPIGWSNGLDPVGGLPAQFSSEPPIQNTFYPVAPPSFFEINSGHTYLLDIPENPVPIERDIIFPEEIVSTKQFQSAKMVGHGNDRIRALGPSDTLAVAKIRDDEVGPVGDVRNWRSIQVELIGTAISNQAKGKPTLGRKLLNENGEVLGYLSAYEGVRLGKDIVVISDLGAREGESGKVTRTLIREFATTFKDEYLNQGRTVAVMAKLRTRTSDLTLNENSPPENRDKTFIAATLSALNEVANDSGVRYEVEEVKVADNPNSRYVVFKPQTAE